MDKLTLALDWTPNINHIGFFIAREKQLYRQHGIDLQITDPSEDNYALTPAKKVELGQADFALCPTESIISYRTKENPFQLIAIAAVLQEDLSAIAVKSDGGINSPRHLDGKRYSSYQARYEDEIVRQMIINDGGKGVFEIGYPNKFGIWNTIIDNSFDATWIFLNWEGVQAKTKGLDLSYFKMSDYGIPYSYSPVIATDQGRISAHRNACSKFLEATEAGFRYCQRHPKEAIKLFQSYIPKKDQDIPLEKALKLSSPHFGDKDNWGRIEMSKIIEFQQWIFDKNLENKKLNPNEIFTNELFG